jgi:hypothetical protein
MRESAGGRSETGLSCSHLVFLTSETYLPAPSGRIASFLLKIYKAMLFMKILCIGQRQITYNYFLY